MSLKKAAKDSATTTCSIQNVTSVVDLSIDEENSAERVKDSNMSACNSAEKLLTSLLFAIPLPTPAKDYLSAHNAIRPVLLYTLPRSVYEKPSKNPKTRKREKEKISKKIARTWNKSIQDGEDIKRGDVESPSLSGKCFGALFRGAACSLRFITTCDNQMLARLPPLKKLGQVQVVFLEGTTSSVDLNRTNGSKIAMSPEEEAEKFFLSDISQAKKETTIRVALAGFCLPIALAAEIFVPLVFEIALIYFLVQYRGWKKLKFLLKKYKEQNRPPPSVNDLESGKAETTKPTCCIFEFKVTELEICQKISKLTYSACSEVNPCKFPVLQDPEMNSHVLINQNEIIEMTEILPLESHSQKILDSDAKQDLPVMEVKESIDTAQMHNTNNRITIELQYNDKNACTLDTAQSIDIDSQSTGVTKEIPKKALPEGASADEPCKGDTYLNKPQIDPPTPNSSNAFTVNEISSEINIPDIQSSPDKKNQPKPIANLEIAAGLIKIFKEYLPPNVVARHELNERRVAEDFNRVLKRRTKEYAKAVKRST